MVWWSGGPCVGTKHAGLPDRLSDYAASSSEKHLGQLQRGERSNLIRPIMRSGVFVLRRPDDRLDEFVSVHEDGHLHVVRVG